MQVKCINNTYKTGWFNRKEKTYDLTVGKTYDVQTVPIIETGYLNRIEFLVYSDGNNWKSYPKTLFEPVNKYDI